MSTKIIDGKSIARKIFEEIKPEIQAYCPILAIIQVGDDPGSSVYRRSIEKRASKLGVKTETFLLESDITEKAIINLIQQLNGDKNINGLIVQRPLPSHIRENVVLDFIDPLKDIDGATSYNLGKLVKKEEGLFPSTPLGVIKILEEVGFELIGKDVTLIGRSVVVGKPLALMLIHRNATVTVCHTKTKDLKEKCLKADLLITAAGKPALVGADMVKDGVFIIDVGINEVDGKIVGDVDFESVKDKTSHITPVPGGVGPVTVAMLFANLIKATRLQHEK